MLTYIHNHELLDFIEFAEYTQYFRDVWVCDLMQTAKSATYWHLISLKQQHLGLKNEATTGAAVPLLATEACSKTRANPQSTAILKLNRNKHVYSLLLWKKENKPNFSELLKETKWINTSPTVFDTEKEK